MRIKVRQPESNKSRADYSVNSTEIQVDFPFQKRPKFTDTLFFPDDLTELSAANISDLHGKYTKLYSFVNQNMAVVTIGLLRVETQESLLRNALFRKRPNLLHQDKWRRDALLDEEPEMEALFRKRQSLLEKKEILQMFLGNYEKYLVALSRELSRKGFEQETRKYGRNF